MGSRVTGMFASGNMLAYVFSRVIGGGLAAPLFVTLVGALSQAKGQLGPAFTGALIGTAIHAGVVLVSFFAGLGTVPVIRELSWLIWGVSLAMPWVGGLVGAVMGYEGSHAKALEGAVPVARPLWIKGGGGLALAWAI